MSRRDEPNLADRLARVAPQVLRVFQSEDAEPITMRADELRALCLLIYRTGIHDGAEATGSDRAAVAASVAVCAQCKSVAASPGEFVLCGHCSKKLCPLCAFTHPCEDQP